MLQVNIFLAVLRCSIIGTCELKVFRSDKKTYSDSQLIVIPAKDLFESHSTKCKQPESVYFNFTQIHAFNAQGLGTDRSGIAFLSVDYVNLP